MLWQVESLFTASLHISDFVQTQNEAKILTVFFKFRFYNILLHIVHTHTVKLEVSLFFRLIKIFGNVGLKIQHKQYSIKLKNMKNMYKI
jgi:hypothetical protein